MSTAMKLTITKQKLESLLEQVNKAVSTNIANPALNGIVLEVTDEQLIAFATNGGLAIKSFVKAPEVTIEAPGKILVNGRFLRELVRQHSGVIALSSDGKTLTLISEHFKSTISLLVISDYPQVDFEAIGNEFAIPAETWSLLVKSTIFACAESDSRLILNGVNIVANKESLTAVATDTFRLSKITFAPLPNVNFSIVINARQLRDLVPPTVKGTVRFVVNEDRIIAFYNQTIAMSNFIVGIYPTIDERIIPKTFASSLAIATSELKQLISRVTAINDDNGAAVRLSVNKQELVFESVHQNIGMTRATTHNFTYHHDTDFAITFNSRFLRDAIDLIPERVLLNFNGEYAPIVVTAADGNQLTQVVMPQRVA